MVSTYLLSTTRAEASLSEVNAFWTTEKPEARFAYVQYVTNIAYLCNAVRLPILKSNIVELIFELKVINFKRLRRFGAKHDLVLIYPTPWSAGVSIHQTRIIINANIDQRTLRMREPSPTFKRHSLKSTCGHSR